MKDRILLPPRVQLDIKENETNSYPTIARLASDNRNGIYPVFFDDTKTVIFETDALVQYPQGTKSGSSLLDEQVGKGYGIAGKGTVRKGISDRFVEFKFNQNLTPFVENKLFTQDVNAKLDPFYTTGSSIDDVGFGFSQPLSAKSKIEIDLNPVVHTTFNLSSTTIPNAKDNFPIVYYNFDKKRWEAIGNNPPLPAADTDESIQDFFKKTHIGFGTAAGIVVDDDSFRGFGLPISSFGFPLDTKFHATSSQVFHLSSTIDRPFVLEKFVLEFSGAIYGQNDEPDDIVGTFFILNQRSNSFAEVSFTTEVINDTGRQISTLIPSSTQLTPNALYQQINTRRDIITFGRWRVFNSTDVDTRRLELNVNRTDPQYNAATGSFIMSASVVSPAINVANVLKRGGNKFRLSFQNSGRDGSGQSTGRDLTASVSGLNAAPAALSDGVIFTPNLSPFIINPYILLPTDKLIFGWQAPLEYGAGTFFTQMTLSPGKGKLTLYGSQIRDGVEFHDTLNQLLVTKNVHEDLHTDNPVLDQFDTEPRHFYVGSHLDEYSTGSLLPSTAQLVQLRNSNIKVQEIERGVVGSRVSGSINPNVTSSLIPGFIRGTQHASINERFYDTLLPRIDEIQKIDNRNIFFYPATTVDNPPIPALGNVSLGFTTPVSQFGNKKWFHAFPFETRYSNVNRALDPLKSLVANKSPVGVGVNLDDPKIVPAGLLLSFHEKETSGDLQGQFVSRIWRLLNERTLYPEIASNEILKSIYGYGDYTSGSVDFIRRPSFFYINDSTLVVGMAGPIPRGSKYGLYNILPQFSKAVWRSSRYGQFRDMLEQRLFSKFYDTVGLAADGSKTINPNQTDAVVSIKFVEPTTNSLTNPYFTWSSNMSIAATSSVPYFDGQARNREEPINITNLNLKTIQIQEI